MAPRFAATLKGKLTAGAVAGVVTTALSNGIEGVNDDQSLGLGIAAGAAGFLGGRRIIPHHLTKNLRYHLRIKLPTIPHLTTTGTPGPDDSGTTTGATTGTDTATEADSTPGIAAGSGTGATMAAPEGTIHGVPARHIDNGRQVDSHLMTGGTVQGDTVPKVDNTPDSRPTASARSESTDSGITGVVEAAAQHSVPETGGHAVSESFERTAEQGSFPAAAATSATLDPSRADPSHTVTHKPGQTADVENAATSDAETHTHEAAPGQPHPQQSAFTGADPATTLTRGSSTSLTAIHHDQARLTPSELPGFTTELLRDGRQPATSILSPTPDEAPYHGQESAVAGLIDGPTLTSQAPKATAQSTDRPVASPTHAVPAATPEQSVQIPAPATASDQHNSALSRGEGDGADLRQAARRVGPPPLPQGDRTSGVAPSRAGEDFVFTAAASVAPAAAAPKVDDHGPPQALHQRTLPSSDVAPPRGASSEGMAPWAHPTGALTTDAPATIDGTTGSILRPHQSETPPPHAPRPVAEAPRPDVLAPGRVGSPPAGSSDPRAGDRLIARAEGAGPIHEQWNEYLSQRDALYEARIRHEVIIGNIPGDLAKGYERYTETADGNVLERDSVGARQAELDYHRAVKDAFDDMWWSRHANDTGLHWQARYLNLREHASDFFVTAAARRIHMEDIDRSLDHAVDHQTLIDDVTDAYLQENEVATPLEVYEASNFRDVTYADKEGQPRLGDSDYAPGSLNDLRNHLRVQVRDLVSATHADFANSSPAVRQTTINRGLDEIRSHLPDHIVRVVSASREGARAVAEFDRIYTEIRDDITAGSILDEKNFHRVRQEFRNDVIQSYYRAHAQASNIGTLRPPFSTDWNSKYLNLLDTIPQRLAHSEFRQTHGVMAVGDLERAFTRHDEDSNNPPLGPESRERLTTEWTHAVDRAIDDHWFGHERRPDFRTVPLAPSSGRPLAWSERYQQLVAGLAARITHEDDLRITLEHAAQSFREIAAAKVSRAHRSVAEGTLRELAKAFRHETLMRFDEIWAPVVHRMEAWLTHESHHEDTFHAPPPTGSNQRDGGAPPAPPAMAQLLSDRPAPPQAGSLDRPETQLPETSAMPALSVGGHGSVQAQASERLSDRPSAQTSRLAQASAAPRLQRPAAQSGDLAPLDPALQSSPTTANADLQEQRQTSLRLPGGPATGLGPLSAPHPSAAHQHFSQNLVVQWRPQFARARWEVDRSPDGHALLLNARKVMEGRHRPAAGSPRSEAERSYAELQDDITYAVAAFILRDKMRLANARDYSEYLRTIFNTGFQRQAFPSPLDDSAPGTRFTHESGSQTPQAGVKSRSAPAPVSPTAPAGVLHPHGATSADPLGGPRQPLEDLASHLYVGRYAQQVTAVWLSARGGPTPSPDAVETLHRSAPRVLFAFGQVDQELFRDSEGRAADAETVASALRMVRSTEPLPPVLLTMPGAHTVAPRLASALNGPVLASRSGITIDPDRKVINVKGEQDRVRLYLPGSDRGHEVPEEWVGASGATHVPTTEPAGDAPLADALRETALDPVTSSVLTLDAPSAPFRGTDTGIPPAGTSVDTRIFSIGVPKAGLPHLPEVVAALRSLAGTLGARVPEQMWTTLPDRLLANYPYLVPRGQAADGLLVPLGPVEALVSFSPHSPVPMETREPGDGRSNLSSGEFGHAGVSVTGSVNATYATGAHVQTVSGTTSATRAGLSVTFGVGLPHIAALGPSAGVSGTMNQSGRSTSHIADSERGHVEDDRVPGTLLLLRSKWTVRMRLVTDRREWSDIQSRGIETSDDDALLLWVPSTYLQNPEPQALPISTDSLDRRIPVGYFASGMTDLPVLFDRIVNALRASGVSLSEDSLSRAELLHRLWNLPAFLDHAVNRKEGYVFRLHDRYGRTVASVALHSTRMEPGREPRVGSTTDTAHIENVRTSIDGTGGGHSLSHSTAASLGFQANVGLPLIPEAGVGLTLGLSQSWTNSEAIGSTRTGLWVMVPRYAGRTSAYFTAFEHRAAVTVRSDTATTVRHTEPVYGSALLRVPEHEALKHGFTVDKPWLERQQSGHEQSSVSSSMEDAPAKRRRQLPLHMREHTEYAGVGMGLVEVPEETADLLYDRIASALDDHGFLLPGRQDNQLGGRSWWQLGVGLDNQVDNEDLLRKFLMDGLGVHHDQIHQDGLTLVLHRRRGFAGVRFDVDSARITIKARLSNNPEIIGTAKDHHLVNLAMGMDSASTTVSGGRGTSIGLKATGRFQNLLGAAAGVGVNFGLGASDNTFYLNNRPELLEYSGGEHLILSLTSDYVVDIALQHSGLSGKLRKGRRDPETLVVPGQQATARVMPLGDGNQGTAPGSKEHTAPRVLDQAVVFHLDTTGVRGALGDLLPQLDGPHGAAARVMDSMTASLRAHLKEAVNGALTTDQPFEAGLLRDTQAAIDIKASLGRTDFVGASPDSFVQGVIKLWLTQSTTSVSSYRGFSWSQASVTAGGVTDGVSSSGGADLNHRWQFNSASSYGQAAAKELIHLSFSRVYLYRSLAQFDISRLTQKDGKLAWASYGAARATVADREVLFILPEPEALHLYAAGELPVSDQQLADALQRWAAGELPLPGNTVAGVLAHWRPAETELQLDVIALASALRDQHSDTRSSTSVWSHETRQKFNERFSEHHVFLVQKSNILENFALPEYLTRLDTGGSFLGHSNVIGIEHERGQSTADLFRRAVEETAPGLLTQQPHLWTSSGRHIGQLQGSIDTIQSLFSSGRDDAAYEDLLSSNGLEFYLTNQVGWFLTDIIKVTLRAELKPGIRVHEARPDAGLENYGHHYINESISASRDSGQSATAARFSSGNRHGGSGPALAMGSTDHSGTKHSESAISEQTVYAWNGLYEVHAPHRFTVTAARVDMPNRPLNRLFVELFRSARRLERQSVVTAEGVTRLHLPTGLAEFKARTGPHGPRDLRPLPKLPGDAYVTGVQLDEALPAARRLLGEIFGPGELAQKMRGSNSLPVLLSRTHLSNLLGRIGPTGTAVLAKHLFQAGSSAHGVELHLRSQAYDLQVVGEVRESGTGRYVKHQSGSSASGSTDRWRPGLAATASGSTTFGPHAADSAGTSAPAGRLTSSGQAAAGTANYRREQHIKQQGPVYLVRMRVRVFLDAHEHRNREFGPLLRLRRLTSEPVNGEMYVELYRDEVDVLRRDIQPAQSVDREAKRAWRQLRHAPVHDMTSALIHAATAAGADAARADLDVSRALRETISVKEPVLALTLDADHVALESYREILRWAQATLSSELPGATQTWADNVAKPFYSIYARQLAHLPAIARRGTARTYRDLTDQVIREMATFRDGLPDFSEHGPDPMPVLLAYTALDIPYLARDIAHHLNTYLRIDIPFEHNGHESRWIDPMGHIYMTDPDAGRADLLTVENAAHHRLFAPGQRAQAEKLRVTPEEIGAAYRDASDRGQTFAQTLQFILDDKSSPATDSLDTDNLGAPPSSLRNAKMTASQRAHFERRTWSAATGWEISQLHRRLLDAGPGASSLVHLEGPDGGDATDLVAVHIDGQVRWSAKDGGPTGPPHDTNSRITSLDLDPHGFLLAFNESQHPNEPLRSFAELRPAAAVEAAHRPEAKHGTAPTSLQHVVAFGQGSHVVADAELAALDLLADDVIAAMRSQMAQSRLSSIEITFTGNGNGSAWRAERAEQTGRARAEAAQRAWEWRLQERLRLRGAALSVPYRVHSRSAGSQLPYNGNPPGHEPARERRKVTIDVVLHRPNTTMTARMDQHTAGDDNLSRRPDFLRDPLTGRAFDFRHLTPDQIVWFLKQMHMFNSPTARAMDPAAAVLPAGLHSVPPSADPSRPVRLDPPRGGSMAPLLVHTVALREQLTREEPVRSLYEGMGRLATEFAGRATVVVWTNVPRSELTRAAAQRREDSDQELLELVDLASRGVTVTSVDEVLSVLEGDADESSRPGMHTNLTSTEELRETIIQWFGGAFAPSITELQQATDLLRTVLG
ncbi:hypothetical protein ACWGJX_38995 [Streptomyces sp. NPDC054775]